MKFRCENVNKAAVHSLLVNAFGDQLTDKVLPCAGRSVQREHQGLLRVAGFYESSHRVQDDWYCDVLSKHMTV